MARQRPVAGQRSRARLAAGPAEPPTADVRDGPDVPPAAERPRRTAVLDRAPTAPTGPPPAAAPGRSRRPDLVVLLAAVVVLALALTAGLLALRARGEDRTERGRNEAVAAAESHAVDLLSYDYRHLDRDFARARRSLTGRFAGDYATTTEKVVRPTAEQVRAVVKADVVASSVVHASQNRVVVLLFVNQTTTSTRLDGPRVDLDRVRLTLDRVGGDWLVSKVVAL